MANGLEDHLLPAQPGRVSDRSTASPRNEATGARPLGNHTYNHPAALESAPEWRFSLELSATQRVTEAATGHSATLFRYPYMTSLAGASGRRSGGHQSGGPSRVPARRSGLRHLGLDPARKRRDRGARAG
ncbi:MAG: polysaccharide deacetylase family protein, partial [Candidatus Dormibacteraeota bacterium]|nr:polysaccharide deacetylase family protein [Candidatus Dormibacteraeota bacterium]